MAETLLQHPVLTNFVYPFLIVFFIVFAVLEKTKLFGEEKKQLNALTAFVIGLIFVSGNTNRFSFPEGVGPFLGRDYVFKTARGLPKEAYIVLLFNNSYLTQNLSPMAKGRC